MQNTKTSNRVLSLVLAVLMVLSLFPAITLSALATDEADADLKLVVGETITYYTINEVDSLNTALSSTTEPATITLLKDITFPRNKFIQGSSDYSVTIDLNGFKCTLPSRMPDIKSKLIYTDSSAEKSGSQKGTLTLKEGADITINGGTFENGTYGTFRMYSNSALTINDGVFSGAFIYFRDKGDNRSVVINGGTHTSQDASKPVFYLNTTGPNDKISINDVTINAVGSIFNYGGNMESFEGQVIVNGGTFVTTAASIEQNGRLTEVNGGTFKTSSTVPSNAFPDYGKIKMPDGKALLYDEEHEYFCLMDAPEVENVGNLTVTPTGGAATDYDDIAAAFDAIKTSGGTITLNGDSALKNQKTGVTLSADVLIDLNGHTLTLEPIASSNGAGIIHMDAGALTIRDSGSGGKLLLNGTYGITMSESSTGFTLESGELCGCSIGVSAQSGINGKIAFAGGKISAEAALNTVAMRNPQTELEVNGNAEIEGRIMVMGAKNVSIGGNSRITASALPVSLSSVTDPITIGGNAAIIMTGENEDAALSLGYGALANVKDNAYICATKGDAAVEVQAGGTLQADGNARFEGGKYAVKYLKTAWASPTVTINGGFFKFTEKPFTDSVTVTYKADEEYTQDWVDAFNATNETALALDSVTGYYIISENPLDSGDYAGYYNIVPRKSLLSTQRIGKDGTTYTATNSDGSKFVFTYQYLDDLVNALKQGKQKASDTELYTEDTLATLNTAITNAEALVTINADDTFTAASTNASQLEINLAYDALMNALNGLKGKSELDPGNLEDGVYNVNIFIYANGQDVTSMANGAIQSDAQLHVKDGDYTLYVKFKPLYLFNTWGHMMGLETFSGASRAAASTGQAEDVPVEDWYTDESTSANIIPCTEDHDHGKVYNSDGTPKCFPLTVRLPLYYHSAEDNRHLIQVQVDMMDALGIGKQRADLAIQWDTLTLDHYFPSLQLDKEEVSVIVGDSNAASDTVAVTVQNADDYTLSIENSDDTKATAVLKDGVVTVTGVAAGETTVTVKLTNNSDSADVISKEISVTVAPKDSKPVEVSSLKVSGGEATATLTGDTLTTNGKKGVSVLSDKVCVNAASEDTADVTAVVLPKSVAKAFADSGKPVEITTNVGIITLDSALLKQISETATKDAPAILSIEKSGSISTKAGNKFDTSYLLNLTVDGKDMDFGSGKATVSVPTELTDGTSAYAYQIKNGKLVDKQTATVAGGNAAWTTTHFSVWAISTKTYQTDESGTQQSAYPDDGNYYVDMTLWKSATDEASMGSKAFELNPKALVTVKDGKITTVQFATNPVDLTGYHTAITAMTVNGEPVTVQETGDLTTIISGETGNDYKYIKRASFNLNTEAPAANEITYVPAHFTVPDTPMDLTMPDGMDARLKFTWSTAVATTDTELTAVEKAPVADGVYSVPVKMMNFTSPDKESMGNAALDGNAIVTVKDGKLTYSLNLKGVTIGTSFGHLLEMWSFADRDAANKLADPVLAAVTATYQDKDLNGGTSTFVKTIAIERSGDAENEIFIRVHVDAMEGFNQNAILVFNWDKATEIVDPCADGHKTEVKNAKDATCTEAGYTGDEVCSVCGETVKQGETIAAKGHTWGEWKVTKAATTSAEGEETRTCSVCGETETHKIPKLDVKNPFVDVAQGQYYYDPVLWAVNHNPQITNGTDATHFSPMATCTRGQVVTFLWRAKGCPEPKTTNNPFKDVKASDYYYKAVLWANEDGITNGTSATTFSPNDPCTRAHVVTFLWRAEGKPAAGSSNPFADVPAGQYYTDAVLWAVNHNPQITNGTSATAFSPNQPCTRGQVVTFLYRDMA